MTETIPAWPQGDRLVFEAERAELTGYCGRHCWKLEQEGKAPRRVSASAGSHGSASFRLGLPSASQPGRGLCNVSTLPRSNKPLTA